MRVNLEAFATLRFRVHLLRLQLFLLSDARTFRGEFRDQIEQDSPSLSARLRSSEDARVLLEPRSQLARRLRCCSRADLIAPQR